MTHEYVPVNEPRSSSEMEGLKHDEKVLLSVQRQESSARAALTEALCVMGRFEEALAIATPEKKQWIEALITAEAAPDDERCDCKYEVDVADYARNPDAEPKMETRPRYIRSFRHWTARYGRMGWLNTCVVCGHVNTLPDDIPVDPETAELDSKRHEALLNARAKGTKTRVLKIA